jgi:hypothetical protein
MEEGRMDEHDSETQRVLHEQRKEVAEQIAAQLGEAEVEPRKTIYRAVKKLGRDQAQLFVQKALEIESAGGLMVPNGSRRRTIGGIFFFLIKTEVPADVTRHIFPRRLPPHLRKNALPRELQAAKEMTPPPAPEAMPAAEPPFVWEDRIVVLAEIAIEERGEIKSVKVTLIGRPGKVVERGQCIVTTMQQQPKLPPLPKGLPIPALDQIEPTMFAVYIATKQWRKVEEAIKDTNDLLIVEGVQLLDKKLPNAIAVFASNVTTRNLQAAQRKTEPQK